MLIHQSNSQYQYAGTKYILFYLDCEDGPNSVGGRGARRGFCRHFSACIKVELKNSSQDNLINHSASNLSYLMVDALT